MGKLFECKICKMKYFSFEFAKKCEKFCKENKACNTELIKYAVVNDEKNKN